jgi:hypothetical protein
VQRSGLGHEHLLERAGVGAGKFQVLAEIRIVVDADGDDVQRAAPVERARARAGEMERFGGLADGVIAPDLDLVLATEQRNGKAPLLAGRCNPRRARGNPETVDRDVEALDRIDGLWHLKHDLCRVGAGRRALPR